MPAYYSSYIGGELMLNFGGPAADYSHGNWPIMCAIDSVRFRRKPEGGAIGAISSRLGCGSSVPTTPEALARAVSAGCSFLPSLHSGKRTPGTWQAQQLFCIDVDNDEAMRARGCADLPMTDALIRAWSYGFKPLISYWSFHSSAEQERYRIVFAKDEPICDAGEADEFRSALMALYPETDQSAKDSNRLFYGTDKEVQLWFNPLQ